MILEIKYSNQFKKDIKLAKKQNKNLDLLFDIIGKIANKEILDEKYKDHNLEGEYNGCRECHIEPDFLLIYSIYDNIMTLVLLRIGSHSNLFK